MSTEVLQGALIVTAGMVVVFVVLGVLTVATMILGRLFPVAPQAKEATPQAAPQGDAEKEIAAAIAVALSLAQGSPPPPAPLPQAPGGLRPWAAYGRQSLMSRRERMQSL